MLPAWCRKPNSFFSQLFLDVKSGQGRLWLCCVLYVFKVETRLQGCRRVVQLPPCLEAGALHHRARRKRVCQCARTCASSATPTRLVKAHGRVDTLELVAGSQIDHLSVSDFSMPPHGKARRQPASASALAPWALVVKRVPSSSQAQRTPEVGPGPVVLSTTLEAH
jgi:hypothetical protein